MLGWVIDYWWQVGLAAAAAGAVWLVRELRRPPVRGHGEHGEASSVVRRLPIVTRPFDYERD